jgi:cytochrome c-type biogenesis protein CcmH/NrfF
MRRGPAIAVLVPGMVFALAAGFLSFREPDPDSVPSIQQVSDRTISPYCAPLTLTECPSVKAGELRQEIGNRIQRGWTNRRIDAWLASNYGAWVVGGGGLAIADQVPALSILAGSILVALFVGRRRAPELVEAPPPAADPADLEQVRRELAEFGMASE